MRTKKCLILIVFMFCFSCKRDVSPAPPSEKGEKLTLVNKNEPKSYREWFKLASPNRKNGRPHLDEILEFAGKPERIERVDGERILLVYKYNTNGVIEKCGVVIKNVKIDIIGFRLNAGGEKEGGKEVKN